MGGKKLLQKSATEWTLSTALGVGAGGASDSASPPLFPLPPPCSFHSVPEVRPQWGVSKL